MWIRPCTCAVAAVILGGCTQTGEPSLSTVQVDTVGSTVLVRHPALRPADASTPILSVGRAAVSEAGAPDEFGLIQAAVLTGDGSLIVADGYTQQVKVFGSSGGFVASFGRRGAGPGEYQRLQGLGLLGDTIVVLDGGNARMSLMSVEGDQYGTWPWFPISGPASMIRYYPAGMREGYVFGVAGSIHILPDGPADTLTIERPGQIPATMLRCPLPDGAIRFFSAPFARNWIGVPAPGGATAAAWNDQYRISIIDAAGDTLRIIEREESAREVTDSEWAEATAEYEAFKRESVGATCTPDQVSRPRHHPILLGIFHDQDGRVVVEVAQEQGSRFDFYDQEGLERGSLRVPARDESVAPYFRDNAAVLTVTDSSDVQSIHVHRWRDRTDAH